MFRISKLLEQLSSKQPTRSFDGKIVIWNFTNRCNLSCLHCYSKAELSSEDSLSYDLIIQTIDKLYANGIKFIIFSGGEPLVRKDIFDIANYAKSKGIITYLSSNGLYINPGNAKKIVETFNYIGVSIDGDEPTHDYFRGLKGSFKKSIEAMKTIQNAGGKVGVRFTMTKDTIDSLPFIFKLAEDEGFDKIYLSHLVYSGRGLENLEMDIPKKQRREAVEYIINKAIDYFENGQNIEVVTGNMECDSAMFIKAIKKRFPHFLTPLISKLTNWGGNSAGDKLLNIDSLGNIKPDPFFPKILGNIKTDDFGEIWRGTQDEMLKRLRAKPRAIEGRCEECKYLFICNGGSRSRAYAISGNLWAEDPSCYLTDNEIRK
jgi:radical SAM protein with 4Fe4S-binding SPASM domain